MDEDGDPLHSMLIELARSIGLLHTIDVGDGGEVSASELFALHELDTSAGLSQQDLARSLRLDKSTVSRLLAGLEGRGLVARERDLDNRRLVRVSLTPQGRRVHRHLATALHAHQRVVLSEMTAAERDALRTGLAGLLRALGAQSGSPHAGARRPESAPGATG